MKQFSILIFLSIFLISCGSSERGVTGSNTTPVSISLSQPVSPSSNSISSSKGAIGALDSQRPSDVESIQVTVTDHDSAEVLVDTTVNVAGKISVTLDLNVPNGSSRLFTVNAYCSEGNLLYEGSASADLNGSNVSLPITMYYYYGY